MARLKKILLVEGETDKCFFEELCKKLALETEVHIAPPKELAQLAQDNVKAYNSKQGVFNYLSTILPQLNDGSLTNIAIIVDADYVIYKEGKQKTITDICNRLTPFGFQLKPYNKNQNGFIFEHSDGLNDLGLWIMSNDEGEGMLEDWIISCLNENESQLIQQAENAIHLLSPPKFKSHHQTKAKVATWLAWQKKPDYGVYTVFNDELLDENSAPFVELNNWLKTIFSEN